MPGIMHVKTTRALLVSCNIRAILIHNPTCGEDHYLTLSLHLPGIIHGKRTLMFQLPTLKANHRVNKQVFAVIGARLLAEVRL